MHLFEAIADTPVGPPGPPPAPAAFGPVMRDCMICMTEYAVEDMCTMNCKVGDLASVITSLITDGCCLCGSRIPCDSKFMFTPATVFAH